MKPKRTIRNFFSTQKKAKAERIDTDPQTTSHTGLAGLYELALRRFKTTIYLLTMMPLYILGGATVGICLVPGIALYSWATWWIQKWAGQTEATQSIKISSAFLQYLVKGSCIGAGFFLFGFTLILVIPLLNFILRVKPGPFRGPYYSVDFLKWFIHNSLTYMVRYTFLEFITPTPFNLLFFRLMGMKIGKGTQINSSNISDPALIELGEFVTIGGSATLCAHYGQGGYLVLAPVKIGNHVTVGLKASVMGGVEIGEGAKILPHSVVLPKTIIPAGETWGGVPAQKIDVPKAA